MHSELVCKAKQKTRPFVFCGLDVGDPGGGGVELALVSVGLPDDDAGWGGLPRATGAVEEYVGGVLALHDAP